MRLRTQILLVTLVAAVAIGTFGIRADQPMSLWLTHDQQAWLEYRDRNWLEAAELFEDPMWRGAAFYAGRKFEEAATAYSLVPTAEGSYNRGNALMGTFDYAKAIEAYELAVDESPGWIEAEENLRLTRYMLEYIVETREQSDTGNDSELGADDYKFDNDENRGQEMTITKESVIELQSAEKWMRSVDTDTRDFLRTRFRLETSMRPAE